MFLLTVNNALPLPSTPASQAWVFLLLMCFALIIIYAKSFSINWFTDSIQTFFRMQDRISIFAESGVNTFKSKLLTVLFSILVFALYAYTLMSGTNNENSFRNFLMIALLIALFYAFKQITGELVGFVFLEKSTMRIVRQSYINIISYLGALLFPMLILQIYLPPQCFDFIKIMALIICVTAFLLFVIKLFLLFFHKRLAFFYIMLYLCTLEILPLLFLLKALRAIS